MSSRQLTKPDLGEKNILSQNIDRIRQCGQTLGMIASRSYWETVSEDSMLESYQIREFEGSKIYFHRRRTACI